jgi:hypothetical protein
MMLRSAPQQRLQVESHPVRYAFCTGACGYDFNIHNNLLFTGSLVS